jgi:saccharopine dehydrogenase-like NADP-dependent oxidoreductase
MAMSLSTRNKEDPYTKLGDSKLGEYQFAKAKEWESKKNLAIVGIGVEPGLSNVFAKYAAKNLFSTIDEIGVRDGSTLEVEGYAFAPTFNIFTLLEECLNPPIIWEKANVCYFPSSITTLVIHRTNHLLIHQRP